MHYRVEELFKLVEEELMADHGTPGYFTDTTMVKPLIAKEEAGDVCKLAPNGWPLTDTVLDYKSKLEEAEAKEVKVTDACFLF